MAGPPGCGLGPGARTRPGDRAGSCRACLGRLRLKRLRAVVPLLPGPDAVVQAINNGLLDRPNSHGTGFVALVYGHLAPAVGGGLDITLVRAGHTESAALHRRSHRSSQPARGAVTATSAVQ